MGNNIAQNMWKLIQTDLSIQKDLDRNLINVRALARYLIDKYDLDFSLDSVISAIRRFETQKIFRESEKKMVKIFKDSKISTRNNIVCFTLDRNAIKLLNRTSSKSIRTVIATDEIKLVFNKSDFDKFENIFSDHIKKIEKDLGELSLIIGGEAIKSKGVMARIANEITLHDINISELFICPPEFLIYVKQKDVIKTHESLLNLTS